MRTVLETCVPRPSIIKGTFNPEVFTASLGPVIAHYKGKNSSMDAIYTDAELFFREGTYPTDGLKQTISNVFRRISGDFSAPSIQRLETVFGGGKTHTLIGCVHIANKGKEIADVVSNILDPAYLPDPGSVIVVGIAGDEIPVTKTKGETLMPYTLWGELAYQVGGEELYKKVQAEAESFASPGRNFLETVLGGKKVLIMLDELAQYAARLEVAAPNQGSDQLAAFLMALNGYAKTNTGIAIIVTLAGSTDAFSKQTRTLTGLLNNISNGDLTNDDALAMAERATKGVTSVIMRDASAVTPVQSSEIAAVLAKRLFECVDPQAADEAADTYAAMYQRNAAMLPERATSVGYRDRMKANYPFHPTLIDFLNNKLAIAENFQGTRGVLRVLAMTIRSIWNRNTKTTLIHVSDIDMQNGAIVDEILGRTGSSDLKTVLNADIGSVSSSTLEGGLSNAQQADKENPHPDGFPLYEMTWKDVFLNSLVGRSEGKLSNVFGISQQDAIFEVATPSLAPSQVRTALEEIVQRAFYLRYEDGKYFAHLDPTINSVLARIRATIVNTQISARLSSAANKLIQGDAMFSAEHNVKYPQDIPDKREKPTVAVISLDAGTINIKEMFMTCGDGKPRVYQNTIVLLVPKTVKVEGATNDGEQMSMFQNNPSDEAVGRLESIARQVIAIKKLEDNPQSYGINASKLNDPEFREKKNERNLALDTTVSEMYTSLYYAGPSGFVKKELRKSSGEGGAPILAQIQDILFQDGELVTAKGQRFTAQALKQLAEMYFLKTVDHIKVQDIKQAFYSYRSWPMIPNKETLEQVMREGIVSSTWVAYKMSADETDDIPVEIYTQEKPAPISVDIVNGGYSIMTVDGAKKRGWLDSDKVPNEKVKDVIRDVMQTSGAATVKDVVDAVKAQYSNATEEQIKDNIKEFAQSGKYGLYAGSAEQTSKPEEVVSGMPAFTHVVKEDDVLITKGEQSERGWNDRTPTGIRLDGNEGAKKLFPILKNIGSLYTRGATSEIDTLDISDMKLSGGGTLRIAIENATPADMKRLDEFFQIVYDNVQITNNTEAELRISHPDENCSFVKKLKE